MKNIFSKTIKISFSSLLFLVVGILLVLTFYTAKAQFNIPTVEDKEILTASKWNAMVNAINSLDYSNLNIEYQNCTWNAEVEAPAGNWATSICTGDRRLGGWQCRWSVNTEEDEAIQVLPDRISCQYQTHGGRAYARAFCCDVVISP